MSVPEYPLVGALTGEPEPLLPVALVVLLLRYLLHLHTHTPDQPQTSFLHFIRDNLHQILEKHLAHPGSLNPDLDPGF
jgi:hypothetical protein